MARHSNTPDSLFRDAVASAGAAGTAALHASEMMTSAAMVVGMRTAMMVGPRGMNPREVRLMVGEKLHAAGQCADHAAMGWQRMQMQLVEAWLGQFELATRFGLAGWAVGASPESIGRTQHDLWGAMLAAAMAMPLALTTTVSRNASSSLAPYRARTARNVKRLARRAVM